MNYEQDVRIDPDALDLEWLEQSALMMKYTKHAAVTRDLMDKAKEKLDFVKAELDLDIRNNPSAYNLPKITEGAIASAISLNEKYQKAVEDYNEARFENEVAQGAVRSIDQKKTALENLVRLFQASYFAGPSVPRDLTEEYLKQENQKQANRGVKINVGRGDK